MSGHAIKYFVKISHSVLNRTNAPGDLICIYLRSNRTFKRLTKGLQGFIVFYIQNDNANGIALWLLFYSSLHINERRQRSHIF
ncbi:hypothetical protein BpHYR1_037862 [Brachionus plicatilis]|uniref:Uncharacterized protein n=1 Tax=Brachionus plicatilis TaxID=10195 RepID=A0A3M7RQW0_BRAPC|nr:hypothetical protein BpHYR1_037862 [Brachionus plicatilis]